MTQSVVLTSASARNLMAAVKMAGLDHRGGVRLAYRAIALGNAETEATMSFPAPYDRFKGEVKSDWIDPNGHMNLAYYIVLFDQAFDVILAEWDLDWAYTKRTKQGIFAVETHTLYEQELVAGAAVNVRSWVINVDSKRLHIAHEMFRASDMRRAACIETLNLHVDLESRKVTPWPEAQRLALDAAVLAHREAGLPAWVGRRVQIRR